MKKLSKSRLGKLLSQRFTLFFFIVIFASIGAYTILGSHAASLSAVYIGQNATGNANGTDCSDTFAASYFNNSANWGSATTQIGPGTTVYLCGTINTTLTAQGSGSSGSPITIEFAPGAVLAQSVCSVSTGCLDISNVSYIMVNGENTGTIENTDNGTDLGNQANSTLIQMQNCNNCEVENTNISDAYVIDSATDQGQAADDNGARGIVLYSGDNDTITDNTMYMDHWAIVTDAITSGSMTNLQISNNNLYNNDHDVIVSTNFTGGGTSGPWYIFNNRMHDWATWDSGSADYYHHDGIHCWGQDNTNPPYINGMYIYNNSFYGEYGNNMNAPVYIEGTSGPDCASAASPIYVFNNLMDPSSTDPPSAGVGLLAILSGKPYVYNNTLLGFYGTESNINDYDTYSTTAGNSDFRNNIVSGGNPEVYSTTDFAAPSDYNLYADSTAGGNGAWICNSQFFSPTQLSGSTSWESCTGADSHSSYAASANVNSDGSLQSDSTARNAGLNLTSICSDQLNPGLGALCDDANGNARPSSGNWDIGAYNYGSESGTPTVSLSSSPGYITTGSSSTLTWSSSNASECTASSTPTDSNFNGSVATSGTVSVSPTSDTTYTLNCSGTSNSASAMAYVNSADILGDLNADGSVNIFDLSIFLNHWEQTGQGLPEDFNSDGVVNIFDLSILLSHWGDN